MFKEYINFNEGLIIESKSELMKIKEDNMYVPKGYVEIYDKKSKELLFKGFNKIMLPGSEFTPMRLFNFSSNQFVTPTYNNYLDLDQSHDHTHNDLTLNYKVYLFCMGTSGCAIGSQLKREVSNKSWILPKDLVPFQYVAMNSDISDIYRKIYFGRKTDTHTRMISYYFKTFDANPILTREFEDGSPWAEDVYSDESTLKANVKVSLTMTVNESDGRSWFEKTVGITDARFNTIEVLAGWPEVGSDGFTYYQDVRPITRLNFPNRALSELNDSFEIKYTFYF